MNPMTPEQVTQKLTEDRGLTARRKEEVHSNKRREARDRIWLIKMQKELSECIGLS